MSIPTSLFAVVLVPLLAATGCGKSSPDKADKADKAGKAAPAPRTPRYTPVLSSTSLPEIARFIRMGDTTVAAAHAQFANPPANARDVATMTMVGGQPTPIAEITDRFNPNPSWPNLVDVSSFVYQGPIGAGVESMYMYFGVLPGRSEPVLVRLEILPSQEAPSSPCDGLRAVVTAAGPERCPASRPALYEPSYLGCIGDEEGDAQLAVWCSGSGALTIELISASITGSLPPAAPLPAAPPVVPVELVTSAPGTWPPASPGFRKQVHSANSAWITYSCAYGKYAISGLNAVGEGPETFLTVGAGCELTLTDSNLDGPRSVIEVRGKLELRNSSVTSHDSDSDVFSRVGALRARDSARATIAGGSFTGSHGDAGAAALFVEDTAELTIKDATVEGRTVVAGEGKLHDGGGNKGLPRSP